jgi:uncharacterized membrane protein
MIQEKFSSLVRAARKRIWLIACVVSVFVPVYAAFKNAPTYDETGHMVAGLSHWEFGRFELYRVNPPLARLVQTLPVTALPHEEDWRGYDVKSPTREEFSIGWQFIEANGRGTPTIFFVARLAGLVFFALGGWMCFLLGSRLHGRSAGIAATCLWCWSPTVLSHSSLITPDVPAAAMGLVSVYWVLKWLDAKDWNSTFVAGLAVAAAMATKATWIVVWVGLIPAFATGQTIVSLFRRSGQPRSFLGYRGFRIWGQSILIGLTCFVILNALYNFQGFLQPLNSFEFRSQTFTGANNPGLNLGNRFVGHWYGKLPCPLPGDCLLGIDRQKMEFEQNKPAYLLGSWKNGGWWYYYFYAAAVKMPVAYLLLIEFAAISFLFDVYRRVVHRDEWIVITVAIVLTWLVSSQTGINKHFRYALPILPLLFVFCGRLWAKTQAGERKWLWVLLTLGALESLASTPHQLSFFNVLVGGPQQGRFHLLNSNVSWGQDVLRLIDWQRERPAERSPLFAALHVNYDPQVLGLDFSASPEMVERDGKLGPQPGLYAIDVNFLMGYPYSLARPNNELSQTAATFWSQFQDREPIDQIGYSIFIYRVE